MSEEQIIKEPVNEGDVDKFTLDEWVGKFNEGQWREVLPEDIATDPSMSKFNGKPFSEIPKAYINLQKSYGDRVPRPRADWTKGQYDEWNKEHNPGYPKSPAEYEIFKEEGDYPYDEESEQFFRDIAYKNGLTMSQAKHMWKESHRREYEKWQTATQAQQRLREEDKTKLKKEWGAAYDEKFEIAKNVLQNFASDELKESLKQTGLSSEVWKFLANIGGNFSEDKLPKARPQTTLTPREATSKAKEYINQNMDAYMDSMHPMHKEVLSKVQEYYKLASPQEKK